MTINRDTSHLIFDNTEAGFTRYRKISLIVLFGMVVFWFSLGGMSLWDNDEPIYAEIAKEMVQSGHWLTPMFNHELWFCHPPFYMWLTAGACRLFEASEWSARFFPTLFAILGLIVVYRFASYLWNRQAGFLSAFVLGSSLQYLVQGRMATMDTMLNTFLLLAIFSGWRALLEKKKAWWYSFFIFCALATISKGLFGIAYPIFILGLFLIFRRENAAELKKAPWISGIGLYLLIAAPWFIYESLVFGKAFLYPVFYFYTFKRVVSPILNQSGPIYYYIPILLLGFFPWSGFLPCIAARSWRDRFDPKIFFLSMWGLSTFLLFTFVNTKLPNYIFFLYPPLAMLIGNYWEKLSRKELLTGILFAFALLGLLTIGLDLLGSRKLLLGELHGYLGNLLPILGIFPIGLLLAFIWSFRTRPNKAVFFILVFTVTLFWVTLLFRFSPVVELYKPMKPMALELKRYLAASPASVLAYHVPGTASLTFYSDTSMTNVDNPELFLSYWKKEKLYAFINESTLQNLEPEIKPYRLLAKRRTLRLISNFNPTP